MISRANKLSFWIASLVLWFPSAQERTRVLSKLIQIGEVSLHLLNINLTSLQHLRMLHNYNTLMGVMAGLSTAAVGRLKATWAALPAKESAVTSFK
jgi:hypothetical protein